MPFQSEKQRRYLWANEPEIAREWTDRYGARGGGIMSWADQGGMKNYLGEQPMVNAPKYWQSRPDKPPTELAYITDAEKDLIMQADIHGSLSPNVKGNYAPNEGPSGIISLDYQGDKGTYGQAGQSYGDRERSVSTTRGTPRGNITTTKTVSPKDHFTQSWSGPKGLFSGGYRNLNVPGDTSQGHQSRFGIGNLFRGAMSMFGGIPGKIGSMLSHINPGKLRGWNEQYGRYNTQDEYEQARTNRRNTKRMDYLSDRKSKGLGYGKKAYADLLGQGYSDTFQDAINRDLQINPETTQFARSHLQSLADKQALTSQLSTPKRSLRQIVMDARRKSPIDNYNYNNMAMMEIANNPALNRYKQRQEELASFYDPWAGPKFQQVGWNPTQKGMVESLKDLGFSAKDAYEKLSNKNKSKGLLLKDYPDPLQPEEFYDKWYGGSFDQLPSNKKGYEVPQDVETQIQNIYKGYI